jgi:transposase InsO family protein
VNKPWRLRYLRVEHHNAVRPHSSLGHMTPEEFGVRVAVRLAVRTENSVRSANA